MEGNRRGVSGTRVLAGLLTGLSAAARAAYRSVQQTRAEMEQLDATHRPLSAIRQHHETMRSVQAKENLSAVETTKLELLQQAAAYHVEPSSDALDAPMRALQQACTSEEARLARDQVVAALETEHHRLFTERLVTACTRASVEAGFPTIETQTRPNGLVRVVATNEAGHALVSEVEAAPDAEPSLAAEVVGVRDGSCNAMLDAFDEALEEEGVRAATPRRTFTGGVCELAAARAFVQRKLRAAAPSKRSSEKRSSEAAGSETADHDENRRQRRARRRQQQR